MAIKRYAPFILLNILISAAVVLGILYFWEQNEVEEQEIATATSVAATAPVATAAAVATASGPPAAHCHARTSDPHHPGWGDVGHDRRAV